ncbi:cancer-related nucleoside-triphosphatase-like protein [Dinothrombium tinctorium]|uniref:Cancer-related nucleoside-triphosphatase-like protein n=1 Tax=Dinothrombium tinctorium TaxID=1965070 RepID=A0A3S3SMP9_9ACAR|nr:cancer-related nucleoside-triphosphatase-like protein [Dinothrombium tinctorium]
MPTTGHILISGAPGVGKTTAIKKISDILKDKRLNLNGFYTREVRQDGTRIGFDIVNLVTGECKAFASVSHSSKAPKVGKYSVDISALESIALSALQLPTVESRSQNLVFLVDEIGKMELLSAKFKQAIKDLFAFNSDNIKIVATIPSVHTLPEVEAIRQRQDTVEIVVTRNNRNTVVERIINMLINNAIQ